MLFSFGLVTECCSH